MLRRAILGRMSQAPDVPADPVPLDVSLSDIQAAAARLTGLVHRTPLLSSTTAAAGITTVTGTPAARPAQA